MTYDTWKTTNPNDRDLGYPDCDVCGRSNGKLRQVWVHGNMETWACAECLDEEPEDDEDAEDGLEVGR